MLFTRTPSVLRVTKNCLQRMHMLAGGHGRVHANVFLAGVLMRRFPSEVFGTATNETRLQQAAGSMLAAFDEMMRGAFASRDFPALLAAFVERFREWRGPQRLQQGVQNALTALYRASAQEPMSPRLRRDMEQQIQQMRSRLERLAGAEAVRAYDAQRPTSVLMPPEQLAHELLLDPSFVLALPDHGTDEGFWASVAADLAIPEYTRTLKILQEIASGLASVGRPFPLDLVRTRALAGDYTWDDCVRLVASIDPAVPMHPPGPRVFAHALRSLLHGVNRLRMDRANERLRQIAPVMKDHGLDYERSKFQDQLDSGALTLERTEVSRGVCRILQCKLNPPFAVVAEIHAAERGPGGHGRVGARPHDGDGVAPGPRAAAGDA